MREDRSRLDLRRRSERRAQLRDLLLHEPQPVHARIQLDVNRITALARVRHGIGESAERVETVDFGFEPVGDHHVEAVGVGVEHHDRHRNPPLAQQYALVGERHGEIVHALMLEHLRDFEIARAVRTGLDHRHEPGPEAQLRPEIVEIMDHGVEIDLQHRRMAFAGEQVHQFFETEIACAFQQDRTPGHGVAVDARDAFVGSRKELLVAGEQRGIAFQAGTDTDQEVDSGACDHARHAAVKLVVRETALRNVRQHERTAAVQRHAVQVVQRQRQRIEVEVVGVVDKYRVVDALLHFETHRHRRSPGERRGGIAHRIAERLDDLGVAARSGVAYDRFGHFGI